jgi:FixJ family two-component response regulator
LTPPKPTAKAVSNRQIPLPSIYHEGGIPPFCSGVYDLYKMSGASLVFVVDDDPSARRGLTRLLRAAGYDVLDFASANEFLDALDPGASGCLILDARMPGLSSEELWAELEARGTHLPIIFVTADDDPATRLRARKMGAVAFFRKPVDGTALLDAVAWTLRPDSAGDNQREE